MWEHGRLWINPVSWSSMWTQMNNKVAANEAASPGNTARWESKSSQTRRPQEVQTRFSLTRMWKRLNAPESSPWRRARVATLICRLRPENEGSCGGIFFSFFQKPSFRNIDCSPRKQNKTSFCSASAEEAFQYFTQQPLCSFLNTDDHRAVNNWIL